MINVLRFARHRISAVGLFCALWLVGCGGSTHGSNATADPPDIESALHYIKASNTSSDSHFGHSMALSADGSTLVIGALYEAMRGASRPT